MPARKRNTADRLLVGWVIGIVVPLLFFLVFYQMKYSEMQFMVYLRNVWDMKIFLKIISLCVFPNLGFFFLFYRNKYDMAARGVIMATFMYAFLVLIAKII
ncbi:hypothetical protein AQPE_4214 [Aquipluma nitroreducens]|uniref:Uncharacterized protein n=1 Tax=Aquipluma nitroreducens TaxID=2010828 RepID=A0A5K7SEP3_9BACT|nr:hypothetical protein [Aquipluma nitroreducens]BBE20023.1 hypothetical protein AQPE_4214 [Aquipluma nitroreducens]